MRTERIGSVLIGSGVALFVIFLVLKSTGHIDWSWWVVSTPLFVLLFLGIIGNVQILLHNRAHHKAISAAVREAMDKTPDDPFAALGAFVKSIVPPGQDQDPPLA